MRKHYFDRICDAHLSPKPVPRQPLPRRICFIIQKWGVHSRAPKGGWIPPKIQARTSARTPVRAMDTSRRAGTFLAQPPIPTAHHGPLYWGQPVRPRKDTMKTQVQTQTMAGWKRLRQGLGHARRGLAQGFFDITHNSLAMLGLAVAFVVIALTARPDLRQQAERHLMALLTERQEANMTLAEPDAAQRATALNPTDLPKPQADLTHWLSRKYGVAPEPLAALVAAAHEIGPRVKLEPTLILAVMAVESGFNPFAQSPAGAQGLMQVMTRVHHQQYSAFGGKLAAFDPVTNMRVGVRVLVACIERAGSLEGGLKFYVGAANLDSDGGYASKVLAEQARLNQVAEGLSVPTRGQTAWAVPVSQPAAQNDSPAVPSTTAQSS